MLSELCQCNLHRYHRYLRLLQNRNAEIRYALSHIYRVDLKLEKDIVKLVLITDTKVYKIKLKENNLMRCRSLAKSVFMVEDLF